MASIGGQLATAIVTALNDGDFSQSFTAVRQHFANPTAESLSALRVLVDVATVTPEKSSRGTKRHRIEIAVVVAKAISVYGADGPDDGEIDGLIQLVEEIADFYGPDGDGGVRIDLPASAWISSEYAFDTIYDRDTMQESSKFVAAVLLTFVVE